MSAPRHVVLLGLMAVGKTTVGRLVACELGWPLSDSDEEIARVHGATVRELNERIGTEAMHRLEAQHLLEAIRDHQPSVVCAAASIIDVPRCRVSLLAPEVVAVWLQAAPETLAERLDTGPHRPELDTDLRGLLVRQANERAARFAAVRPVRVNVSCRTPDQIAQDILAAVPRR